MAAARPNVFAFADYRRYLAAYYAYAKAEQYGFSFRVLSRRAGLRSSNYVGLVINGKRNLTAGMAERFAAAAELSGDAAHFFCELVAYCQAKSTPERTRLYERLARYRSFREARQLESAQAEYHCRWYLPAIRELVRRADFTNDPKWIARQLTPNISPAQAKRAVSLLIKLGLLEDTSGRLRQTTEIVTTGPGPLGHHVYQFHHTMLERAAEALDTQPREERDISSVTLCVSAAKLDELKQRVRAFRQELLRTAELDDQPERVVQINFQIFPLSVAVPARNDAQAAPAASGAQPLPATSNAQTGPAGTSDAATANPRGTPRSSPQPARDRSRRSPS